ncbi:MAG: NifB/NifX family molybdenum-iron cluster-binding protein [Aminivibrio sp.]|jgi:predicted Fe-Mo cluster-binding NifX family protein
MTIIGIASAGRDETAMVADRFARAPWFLIADGDGKILDSLENDAGGEQHGAASKALMTLSEKKVSVVLAPRLGPNAMGFMKQANMEAYCAEGMTVREALDGYRAGALEKLA